VVRVYSYDEPTPGNRLSSGWAQPLPGQGRDQAEQIRRFFETFRALLSQAPRAVLVPWILTALVDFVFVAASVLLVLLWGGTRPWERMPTGVSAAIQIIAVTQVLIVYTLRVALFKTLRDVAYEGALAVGTPGRVFRDLSPRLVPVLLTNVVVFALIGVGFMLCVLPGLLAMFFLAFAPYLVAAHGHRLGDALQHSARIARHQWLLLLTALVVAIAAAMVFSCVGLGTNLALAQPLGRFAMGLGMIGTWVVHTVVGFLAWMYWGAVYLTAESGEATQTYSSESSPTAVL
jgi:hypothetical protein